MTDDLIRYDVLTQEALRGVVRKVMVEVAQTGLPGDHHFFITFDTHHPDARISSRLAEQYPDEMTVVMQHQFWDLNVTDTAFEIGLSFNGVPERLLVPFKAISAFGDPDASFGLKFEATAAEGEVADEQRESDAEGGADETAPDSEGAVAANDTAGDSAAKDSADAASAEVVSLDAFRKKNG
jgi:hypothetical protein